MTRDEAARAFAKKTGLTLEGCGGMGFGTKWCFARRGSFKVTEFFDFPAPDAPLHEKLAFTGRIAEAVFPNEDEVFRCGWVHGVLENCIEDARVKYDLCWVALLAALAALEAR